MNRHYSAAHAGSGQVSPLPQPGQHWITASMWHECQRYALTNGRSRNDSPASSESPTFILVARPRDRSLAIVHASLSYVGKVIHVIDTRRAHTYTRTWFCQRYCRLLIARFVMHRHFVFPRENFACQPTNRKVNGIHDATRGRLPRQRESAFREREGSSD